MVASREENQNKKKYNLIISNSVFSFTTHHQEIQYPPFGYFN